MGNSFNASKVIVSMVVVLSVGLLLFVVQPGRAGIVFNVIEPFEFTFPHPCTGEPVHLEGTNQLLFHQEGEHGDSFHFNQHGRGEIVATGEKCVIHDTYNDQCTSISSTACGFDLDADDFDLTSRETFTVVCQGRAPNFIVSEIVHTTFPPFQVEVLHQTARCVE